MHWRKLLPAWSFDRESNRRAITKSNISQSVSALELKNRMALPIDQRVILIVGLTLAVIVAVVVVRVLTGRPWSNLSKRNS